MKVQSVETGWAVVDTKMNRIIGFGGTKHNVWCRYFFEVSEAIGHDFAAKHWNEFTFKYRNRLEPSIRAAAKEGFKLVRATRTVEVKIK